MTIKKRAPTRCALLTSLGGLLSCGPAYVAPEHTGGELLPDTESWDDFGADPFSVSPDGRWLMFVQSEGLEPAPRSDFGGRMLRYLSAYVVYDLVRLEATRVALGSDVGDTFTRMGGGFLPTGCWIPEAEGWRAAVPLRGQYLIADPEAERPEWIVADAEPYAFSDLCPLEVPEEAPGVVGRFRVAESAGKRISIVDAEDTETVLATHRASWFPGMDITLRRLRLAPEGTRLAYDVGSTFGSLGGRSTAFVISYDDGNEPVALASSVYGFQWGGDDTTLYAAVAGEGARGLYRWRLGH